MDILSRIDSAQVYFRYLARVQFLEWGDIYSDYLAGGLILPEAAVLIPPRWRSHLEGETRSRRQRAFTTPPPAYASCAAHSVWGYACPMVNCALQTDHRFPWALGGPTRPENAVYLCHEHNLMKGHDVHLIEWTPNEFSWLRDEIEEVRYLLATKPLA
jgi:hypothetical protein